MVSMRGSDLPYLIRDHDRHGNVRYYAQRPRCKKVRIRAEFGTPAFKSAYAAALADSVPHTKPRITEAAEGSLRWLCQEYMGRCIEFKRLDPQTRHVRKLILDKLCLTPHPKGGL